MYVEYELLDGKIVKKKGLPDWPAWHRTQTRDF
jgi:hypothetical protein